MRQIQGSQFFGYEMNKRTTLFPLAILILTLTGCQPAQPPTRFRDMAPPSKDGVPMKAVNADTSLAGKKYRIIIRLRMIAVEMPIGTVSDSEELWSYLNEEAIRPRFTAGLTRNGIRLGIGKNKSWQDIATLLNRMTGQQVKERSMICMPGNPVSIVIRQGQPERIIFAANEDGTISGSDYPAGDYIFTFNFTLNEDDPSRIMVTGAPVIRSKHRETKIIKTFGKPMVVQQPILYSFRSLMVQFPIASRDFIVLGPGVESRRNSSVGHHFLVKQREGIELETVIIVMPEVFAAEIRKPKPLKLPGETEKPSGENSNGT